MNQIVEKVEQITANGKHTHQGSVGRDEGFSKIWTSYSGSSYGALMPTERLLLVQDFKNNLAGEAQKEVLKENFYNELTVQEEIRRRQKALDVADDRLKFQVTK